MRELGRSKPAKFKDKRLKYHQIDDRNKGAFLKPATIFLMILLCAAMACNMPLFDESEKMEFGERMLTESGIVVSDIYLQGDQVVATYDSPWTVDEATYLTNWLVIMTEALEESPSSSEVRVDIKHLGSPLFSVTSSRSSVESLLGRSLPVEEFYDQLAFSELRPPAQAIIDTLKSMGVIATEVSIVEDTVTIKFFQQQAESTAKLLLDWVKIIDVAAIHAPDSDHIMLEIIYPGSPTKTLDVKISDVNAFRGGFMSPAEFLSSLQLTE
jgi:hypothetical protein